MAVKNEIEITEDAECCHLFEECTEPSICSLSHSTSSNSLSSDESRKSVKFGDVRIREYNRIVGDHPDTRVGPPMSIGWAFIEHEPKKLDIYEITRASKRMNLRLTSITRKNMLRNVFDADDKEMLAAERAAQKIRKQRQQTNSKSGMGSFFGTAFRSMGKKIGQRMSKEKFIMDSVYSNASSSMVSMGYF